MLIFKVKQGRHVITCDSCKVTTTSIISLLGSFEGNSFTYTKNTNLVVKNSG